MPATTQCEPSSLFAMRWLAAQESSMNFVDAKISRTSANGAHIEMADEARRAEHTQCECEATMSGT